MMNIHLFIQDLLMELLKFTGFGLPKTIVKHIICLRVMEFCSTMKAREEAKLSTLRMVLSALQNAEVAGDEAVDLSDDQIVKVLQAESKKRLESAEIYEQNGRAEAAATEKAEAEVLAKYLPAAMSDSELAAVVAQEVAAAAAAGNAGMKAMGLVVKAVREKVGSSADGSKIADLVKSALAQ